MADFCTKCSGLYCEEHRGDCPEGHVAPLPSEYADPFIRDFFRASAIVEKEGYLQWTRVREVMELSRKMNFRKLGIAFCTGLKKEAEILRKILENNGFDVCLAVCKMDGHDKSELGIAEQDKFGPGFDPMCNPIRQAHYLSEQHTDFNIIVGLCVGHDSLFFKHSEALCTTLVAKDRVLGHNPAAALYLYEGYLQSKVDMDHK